MRKTVVSLLLLCVLSSALFGQDYSNRFDPVKMRERVIRLSADDFEGRGPGTEGGKRAAQYIADQMKASGLRPTNGRSYFQNVKMVGVKADPNTKLEIGGHSYKFGDDFVATTSAQRADVSIDADLVFAGYGIDAPNFNWNDYSGNPEDYRGKVLMIMVNDPPATKAEPNLFGDKGLTYYGRWTYKYEEAARRGAAGVILIHSTESAGYGWNVIRTSNGSWPKLRNEYVVYTAHWDHLGIGEPDARGDKIYNGAYDNASGVAAVLGIAEAFAKMPKKERPKRSMLFLFPTAEEQGLLGAEYYSMHPLVPLAKTAANVNIDGVNFFGKTKDFSALGAERSSIETIIADAARERSLTVEGDTHPEQGFFFRSDHFPFAKVGVPSISLRHGDNFVTPLKDEPEKFFRDYTAKYYHQASDEYKDWWDTSAIPYLIL